MAALHAAGGLEFDDPWGPSNSQHLINKALFFASTLGNIGNLRRKPAMRLHSPLLQSQVAQISFEQSANV